MARQADQTGAVRTAPVVRLTWQTVFRAAVLAGSAAAVWLVCGSTTAYADQGTAPNSAVGTVEVEPNTATLGQVLGPVTDPATGAASAPAAGSESGLQSGLEFGPEPDLGLATGPDVRSDWTLDPVTTAVSRPADRIAAQVTSPTGPVPSLERVARVVRPGRFAPAAPLLRPVHAMPDRVLAVLDPVAGSPVDPLSTGGVVGPVDVLGVIGPVTPTGPVGSSGVVGPVDVAGTGPTTAPVRSARRYNDVSPPVSALTDHPVGAPVRHGPDRAPGSGPGPRPAGPDRVPATPVTPAPAGASGQVGSNGQATALPVDRAPDAAPGLGQQRGRSASTGPVRHRADDPSITPD